MRPAPLELWQVDGAVTCGNEGPLRWSSRRRLAVCRDRAGRRREHGGPEATANAAYAALREFVGGAARAARSAHLELPRRHQRGQRRRGALQAFLRWPRTRHGRLFRRRFSGRDRHRSPWRGQASAGVSAGLRRARPAGGESAPGQRVALPAPVRPHPAQLCPGHGAAGTRCAGHLRHRRGGRPRLGASGRSGCPAGRDAGQPGSPAAHRRHGRRASIPIRH